ncbi:MAG: hypothetical protein ACFE8P_17115, partial [Promethearchaeota archaeon]
TNFYELYNFTLSEFYIETDTWVQASNLEDNDAWITDPAKADTDGDGWSDYYEIYLRGDEPTNPCSVDTDGDGAWDPNDRDPRRDLLIQIKFIEGKFNHLETKHAPKLQAVVEFEVLNQEFYFTTEPVKATWNKNEFDVPQRASFGHKYYFNVEDDKKVQGNWFNLEFELWWMWPIDDDGNHLGDKKLLSDDCDYLIGSDPKEKWFENAFGNELFVQMATLAIDKCNTIAIYDANSTFNGRYQEQERMNVIQLYVTDSGGPFKAGPNAIVIPTSLFTNTKLNSYIQKEQLAQTPLYSPDENFQFISVDRDKGANSDDSTSKVDFVIIRKEISSSQAMEVLDLLTIGIINESLDENNMTVYEEEKVYTYVSTEINGTIAVDMNLAPEVMKYIPWFNCYLNSPQGREPTSKSNVATPTEIILNFCKDISKGDIIGAFSNAFSSIMLYFSLNPSMGEILAIIMAVIDFLVMLVLTILGPLLWLIIRAVLLVLIWIQFALLLALLTVAIVILIGIMLLLSTFLELNVDFSINYVHVSGLFEFSFGYEIKDEYNDFLQEKIPAIEFYIDSSHFGINIFISFFNTKIDFYKFPIDIFDSLFNDESESGGSLQLNKVETQIKSLKNSDNQQLESSSESNESSEDKRYEYFIEFVIGIADSFAIAGLGYEFANFLSNGRDDSTCESMGDLTIGGLGVLFWLLTTFKSEDDIKKIGWACLGLGLGFVVMGGMAVLYSKSNSENIFYDDIISKNEKIFFKNIELMFAALGVSLDFLALNTDIEEKGFFLPLDFHLSVVGGFFGFISGIHALEALNERGKDPLRTGLGLFTIAAGITFAMIAVFNLMSEED